MRNGQYHLFKTKKEDYDCIISKHHSFGVKERSINQIANVHSGDTGFFYVKWKKGNHNVQKIYGPFSIVSGPYYDKNYEKKDKPGFSYRVKIKIPKEEVLDEEGIDLWEPFGELKNRTNIYLMYSSAINTYRRSVINLLPEVGEIINKAFGQPKIENSSRYKIKNLSLIKEVLKNIKDNKFEYERYLEIYLLNLLHKNKKLPKKLQVSGRSYNNYSIQYYNQIPTYFATSAIDVVIIYKNNSNKCKPDFVEVIELKNKKLAKDHVNQLVYYINWTQKLFSNLKKESVRGILIGAEKCKSLYNRLEEFKNDCYNLSCFTYKINENNDVVFDKFFPNK